MPFPESTRDSEAESSPNRLLSIDTGNLFRDRIGAEGVTHEELLQLTPELNRVHAELVTKSAGGLDGEFGCLHLGTAMRDALPQIRKAAAELRQYRDILLIGIGGSNLGTKAIRHALKPEDDSPNSPGNVPGPRLHFIENIDSYHMERLLRHLSPETTALLCISKSGGTIETVVQFLILRDWLERSLGAAKAKQHQWVITDPKHGWLRELARSEDLAGFPVPPQVGGRYSVLSAVGLLPLATLDVDVDALLQGTADSAARCLSPDPQENPALHLAGLYYLLEQRRDKRISIMMPYVNRLRLFADWYCQLWAESLGKWQGPQPGKKAAGSLPVRAMGAVDQHSQLQMYLESRHDKMFTFINLDRWDHDFAIPLDAGSQHAFPYLEDRSLVDVIHAEFRATRQVITDAGHPNLTLGMPALDAHTLGQLIDLFQRTTIYTGLLYGINPLDQPSVEKGKKLAVQYLQHLPS
ncbi:MAG: hypothetical protein ACYDHM_08135 [Acidiferrobacterales bacterium]